MQNRKLSKKTIFLLGWLIYGLATLFYIYEYYLRIMPSLVTTELMHTFHISSFAVGNLAAFYYYAYAPMQLPVGLILDRFGPRRSITLACLACAVGTLVFAHSHLIPEAEIGRFMIGFGSAFAFVGVLKLASVWMPAEQFGMLAGLASGLGTLGAMSADIFLSELTTKVGWHTAMWSIGLFGLGLAAILYLAVRDKKPAFDNNQPAVPKSAATTAQTTSPITTDSPINVWHTAARILQNPQLWIVGIIGCLMYLPTSAFAELWAVPYLRSVYHLHVDTAATITSFIFLGFTIGAPIYGLISDRLKNRRLPMLVSCILGAAVFGCIILTKHLSMMELYIMMFLLGFSYSAQAIVFAVGHDLFRKEYAGTAIATTNMFVMLSGVIFQPVVGRLLDFFWTGHTVHGIRVYSEHTYQYALIALPVGLLLAGVLVLMLRETGAKRPTLQLGKQAATSIG